MKMLPGEREIEGLTFFSFLHLLRSRYVSIHLVKKRSKIHVTTQLLRNFSAKVDSPALMRDGSNRLSASVCYACLLLSRNFVPAPWTRLNAFLVEKVKRKRKK